MTDEHDEELVEFTPTEKDRKLMGDLMMELQLVVQKHQERGLSIPGALEIYAHLIGSAFCFLYEGDLHKVAIGIMALMQTAQFCAKTYLPATQAFLEAEARGDKAGTVN